MDCLPSPSASGLWLVISPGVSARAMLDLAARLALGSPLRVLDGGNRFNSYICCRAAARALGSRESCPANLSLETILSRISVARAFTCYQMLALLEETPAESTPTLVLDLLSTFYDEDVTTAESYRLLEKSLSHLQRLSQSASVIVSACPPPSQLVQERLLLLDALETQAQRIWRWEAAPPPASLQPPLPFQ